MPYPDLSEYFIDNLYFNTQIKLIYERFGFYHSETGNWLNDLIEMGRLNQEQVQLSDQEHPYIFDSKLSEREKELILQEKIPHYDNYQLLIHNQPFSGDFAEAIIFLALCDSHVIHKQNIEFHILKPQMNWIDGKTYRMDFPLIIEGEIFSVEVKNNSPQLNPISSQISNLLRISSSINPVLVNRQSTKGLKSNIMKRNGRVLDFNKLLLLNCSETEENIKSMEELNLSESAFFLPRLKINSLELDGREFKSEIKNLSIEALSEASSQIPELILKKTRGLIRLLYFGTLYRKATKLPKGRKSLEMILSLIFQSFYYYILGAKNKTEIDTAYEYASRKIGGPLQIHLSRNRKEIYEEFLFRLDHYYSVNLLTKFRGKCWIEDAVQPENWLRYS